MVRELAFLGVAGCAWFEHGVEGESCKNMACAEGLECFRNACTKPEVALERVLEGSTVQPMTGRTGAVRVVEVRAEFDAAAQCGDAERLVGGYCTPPGFDVSDSGDPLTFSSVGGHTPSDTIGAYWRCKNRGERVTAVALCQRVE